MRLCIFLGSNIRSGANLSLLRHAAALADGGHDVGVVFRDRFFAKEIDFIAGGEAIMTRFLDEVGPDEPLYDVVITNWWQCAYDLERLPARRCGYFRHGDEAALYDSRLFDAVIAMLFQEDFLWFCVSPDLAEAVAGARRAPIVLPNGVDLDRFATAAPTLGPRTGVLRVMVEGSTALAHKRVDATIEMLRGLSGIEIVHMAGDGTMPHAPIAHALGAVPHSDVAGVYASCDLIVKLSALESFAMPVLEQFAAGGSAVVADFPGRAQYITEACAVILEPSDPFAAAAAAVTGLRDDPARLAGLRREARMVAADFDWTALHRQFAAELASALRDAPHTAQTLQIVPRFVACQAATLAAWSAQQAPPPSRRAGLRQVWRNLILRRGHA
jgi:glycosyltransferase involved in cell wall biosynthesis